MDVLVNNAGVAPNVRADLLDMSEESFTRVLTINLMGPFFLTQLAARKIMENGNGKFHCIVNIGSVSAGLCEHQPGGILSFESGRGDGDEAVGGAPCG